MKKWIFFLLILVLFSGCQSGGDTPENSDSNITLDQTRFTIDESDFRDTRDWQKVEGTPLDAKVVLDKRGDGLELSGGEVKVNSLESQYRFPTTVSKELIESYRGKPLYIDGVFAGIISGYDNGEIVVKDAKDVSDAYSRFDISGGLESIPPALMKTIRRHLARYDRQNRDPLGITFSKRIRSVGEHNVEEPVLSIEFPKGYTIPLKEPQSVGVNVGCDLSEAMCDASFNYNKEYEKDMEASKLFGSVTFTSEGSKIVVGLGAFIRAMYDYNSVGSNEYYFEFKPTLYYDAKLQVAIKGSSIKGGDKTFELIKNGLEISIPLHKAVSLVLQVKPEIVLGMKDAPNNEEIDFSASVSSKRTGYAKLVYSSLGSSATKGIEEEAEPLSKEELSMHLDTGNDKIVAYIFPEVAVRPQLKFTKISRGVNIAYVRNGVSIDTKLKGTIDSDWIVENTEITGSAVEDVYVKSYLYGLVDYKWDVKVGDTQLYESDDWIELYNGEKSGHTIDLLEWWSQFLQLPTIKIDYVGEKRLVRFDIGSKYKNLIRFYYTLNQEKIDSKVINANRDHTPYKMWRIGDEPIELDEDTHIDVRAVLFTDEIPEKSSTLWVWGMSISKTAKAAAVYVPPVVIEPTNKDFVEPFSVRLTQVEGDGIEISSDDGYNFQSCGTGSCSQRISKTSTLVARAVRIFDGKKYYSTISSGYYRKCPAHEEVGADGKCVTRCPYLWDLSYSEEGVVHYDGGEPYTAYGTAKLYDVFIDPECDFRMTEDERRVCQPYIDAAGQKYSEPGHTMETPDLLFEWIPDPKEPTYNKDTSNTSFERLYGMWSYGNLCAYEFQPARIGFVGTFIGGGVEVDEFHRKIMRGVDFTVVDPQGGTYTFHHRPYQRGDESQEDQNDQNSSDQNDGSPDNVSDDDTDNGGNVDGEVDGNQTFRWYITWHYQSGTKSGSMSIKNIKIDCRNTVGDYEEHFGRMCSLEFDINDVVYEGDLLRDSSDSYLTISEKGAGFDAEIMFDSSDLGRFPVTAFGYENIDPEIHSSALGCVFQWEEEYSQNILEGKAFSFQSRPGDSSCTFEFSPCTSELCGE